MIKRFYVHNFRCLENFELPISEKPSALLIGANGSGKSTIGFALEILQRIALGVNRVGGLVKPTDFARGRSQVPMRFEIEVAIEGTVYEYRLALELPDEAKELQIFDERLTVAGDDIYSRSGAQVQLPATEKRREAQFPVDWHLVALPLLQEQSIRDPLYVFKNWLSRMLIIAPIPYLMKGDSEEEALLPDRAVSNFGEWFSGLLAHSPSAYKEIDRYLRAVMPDFVEIRNPIGRGGFRNLVVQFKQDKATLSLPFSALSDGEKCFLLCALVLAANQAYGPFLCFWDEPDNYLSLSEVGHFVMDLRRSFREGGQLVVTSHNSEAIRKFSDENTLALQRHSHLEPTLLRPLSEIQVNGNLIDALIRNDVEL